MKLISIVLIFYGTSACAHQNNYLKPDTSTNIELYEAWVKFANAVLANDLNVIKSISTQCIRVDYPFCITDTTRKDSLFELNDETKFVDIDVF